MTTSNTIKKKYDMNKKISNKTKLLSGVILLFSFFLGFGIYDPFNTNGLYFDLITVLVVITSFLYTDVLKDIKSYKGTPSFFNSSP